MSWTALDRFLSTCRGEIADRPPLAVWRHFRSEENSAEELAESTASLARALDMDWIKLNPRAVYYAEIWGNTYDADAYDAIRDVPLQTAIRVTDASDLATVERMRIDDSSVMREQVSAVRETVARADGRPVVPTLFSPLSTLFQMSGVSYYSRVPVYGVAGNVDLLSIMRTRPGAVHRALRNITDSYVALGEAFAEAGGTGLFYAVTGTANTTLLPTGLFNEFSLPYDVEILESVGEHGPRIVHTCGPASRAADLLSLPAEVISWDHHGEGNPSLDELPANVIAGGLDHRRFRGEDVTILADELSRATELARSRPLLLAPTCSVKSYEMSHEAETLLAQRK